MGTLVTKGWFLFNFVNMISDLPNNFSLISVEKIFRCNSFIFNSVSSCIKTLTKQSLPTFAIPDVSKIIFLA